MNTLLIQKPSLVLSVFHMIWLPFYSSILLFLLFTLQLEYRWSLYFCSDACLRAFALFHLPWTAFHKTPYVLCTSPGVWLRLPFHRFLNCSLPLFLSRGTQQHSYTSCSSYLCRFCFQHRHYGLAHRTHSVHWKQTYTNTDETSAVSHNGKEFWWWFPPFKSKPHALPVFMIHFPHQIINAYTSPTAAPICSNSPSDDFSIRLGAQELNPEAGSFWFSSITWK